MGCPVGGWSEELAGGPVFFLFPLDLCAIGTIAGDGVRCKYSMYK